MHRFALSKSERQMAVVYLDLSKSAGIKKSTVSRNNTKKQSELKKIKSSSHLLDSPESSQKDLKSMGDFSLSEMVIGYSSPMSMRFNKHSSAKVLVPSKPNQKVRFVNSAINISMSSRKSSKPNISQRKDHIRNYLDKSLDRSRETPKSGMKIKKIARSSNLLKPSIHMSDKFKKVYHL